MTWLGWFLLGWVLLSPPVALLTGRVIRELEERRGFLPRRKEVRTAQGRTGTAA